MEVVEVTEAVGVNANAEIKIFFIVLFPIENYVHFCKIKVFRLLENKVLIFEK